MTNQDIVSGTFYVDNGFRPCIAKSGYKWAHLLYLNGTRVKCKKIRNQKTGKVKPIVGARKYTTEELAVRFLTGRTMSKKAQSILIEIVMED
jgi:hypothetical protein